MSRAAELLATVLGQDLDRDEAAVFRIARRVAKDRLISTVDTQTRHGHKTAARGFDGYKGHIGTDPDSEIITATHVTPGNIGDGSVAEDLIADLLNAEDDFEDGDAGVVYGDNAYGTGAMHERLERAGIESKCKTQQPVAAGGWSAKDRFGIDLDLDTVTCPAGQVRPIRRGADGAGSVRFGKVCASCPLRQQCTTAAIGRSIEIGVWERQLAAAWVCQRDPGWDADYRATRPKVERKIGHLMRRRHGGRRARVRGNIKIAADFSLLAAAVNLARLAVFAVTSTPPRMGRSDPMTIGEGVGPP